MFGWQKVRESKFVDALRWVTQLERTPPVPAGFHHLKAVCLEGVARYEEALDELRRELEENPGNAAARGRHDQLVTALMRPVTKVIPTAERSWNTSLPRETLLGIQQAIHNYHYRGVPLQKNPFDVALYPMLVWKVKPVTIFEIGSKSGGSGLWFGDMVNSFGFDSHVYSLDVVKVDSVSHPRVTFMEANGRCLEETLTPDFLEGLPRPWLVIEDADHVYETSSAVLRFFHPWLRVGEYIVVEDGIISNLAEERGFVSGPHMALKEFLAQHAGEYEIAGEYCDFFGYNLTWCTNGFLRKIDSGTALDDIRRLVDGGRRAEAFALLNEIKARRVPVRGGDYLRALCFVEGGQPFAAIEALKEELRYFPDNGPAKILLESLSSANRPEPSVAAGEFNEIMGLIRPYTMLGEKRLLSLFNLAREICELDLPGNFVECGVAAGGSSALLAAIIARHSRRPRKLFSFDTFEGMPVSTELDTHQGQSAEASGWGAGTCAAPEASLREACDKLGVAEFVEPVKGLFSESLPVWRERVGPIAFLHMDGDWYSSTTDIFENLFDQVVPGGHIQIDDYGYWDGCRRAVADFEQKRGLKFQLHRIDETGVWLSL